MVTPTLGLLRVKSYEYAEKRGLIAPIEEIDARIKGKFLLKLGFHGLIPKRKSFHGDTVIMEHIEMFLDWYLFEWEAKKGKTIAELYVRSKDFKKKFRAHVKKMKTAARKLKHPLWGYFVVCKKGEKNEYDVRMLEGKGTIRVHDESSFPHVREGIIFHAKLYPFGGKYYASGGLLVMAQE